MCEVLSCRVIDFFFKGGLGVLARRLSSLFVCRCRRFMFRRNVVCEVLSCRAIDFFF